jgi:GT2 family glycosyltransferase
VFEEVGGLDEMNFPRLMFDVDLCLRLRERGKRIVVLPHVEFVRRGERTDRGPGVEELARFKQRWSAYAERDPFCNVNLKRDGSFELK